MKRTLIAPIALACALLSAANARATTVTFDGFSNGSQSVDFSVTAPNVPLAEEVDAGGVTASVDGGPSFTSYCINLYNDLNPGGTYQNFSVAPITAHTFANANAPTDLGKLFSEGNAVNTSVAQAAMQIAIWEIAYETSGVYNLAAGTAQFSGGTAASSGALTLASSWLAELPAQADNATLGVLQSVAMDGVITPQDQIFAIAVPEPSTYALLAGGLMCVGFITRRRGLKRG